MKVFELLPRPLGSIFRGLAHFTCNSPTWSLAGTNTFTGGLTVSNGTLEVISPSGTYTWYRWNMKRTKSGGAETRVVEFGLYDVDGNRVNGNLAQAPSYPAIRRGEAAVQRQMTSYYGAADPAKELVCLFDDTTANWDFFTPTTGAAITPDPNDETTWYRILMRLPANAATVASYDVVANGASSYAAALWSLEGSVDGMNWDEVDHVDSIPYYDSNQWAWGRSGGKYADGKAATHTGGRAIAGSTNKTVQAISPDCPVSVASGATLRCVGTAELANLAVDFAGAGTISGFRFASQGTIDVRNAPRSGGDIPLSFADTADEEVAKIAGWTLCRDGVPSSTCRIAASGGALRISPIGIRIIFR